MKKARLSLVVLLILLTVGAAGCGYNYRSLLPGARNDEAALIRVRIRFVDQAEIPSCYVKSLGIDLEAQVYAGGPSSNYIYDQDRNIIGSFNYQNVLYMMVLPDDTAAND